jgi:glycosyltransferase involved in cell wall biosynthesis
MHILNIIASLNPADGGPVQALATNAGLHVEAGHGVEIATLDDPSASYLSQSQVPVHALGPGLGRYAYTAQLARWLADNAERFDVALVHGLWNHAGIGAWQGLRSRLPYVVFAHGMLDPWFARSQPLKHIAKQAFWLAAQGHALAAAHAVLMTGEEEMRLARHSFMGPGYRERIVPLGVLEPPPASAEQIAAFRRLLPDLASRKYLLFLGRIHPKKGCDMLIEAFANLAFTHTKLDLVMAGPDQVGLRANLEFLAAKAGVEHRIHWPGMLSGDAKWGALHGAEALILPSHQENFGLVIAEAMACGKPVLISDKINIWREVEGCGGGLVRPDTSEGTAALLADFRVLKPAERAEMGRAARRGYQTHFNAQQGAEKLLAVFEEAIAANTR